MNALQPTTTEIVVTLTMFVIVMVMLAALVDAVRRNDAVGAVLLVLLGPIGLMVYVARRSSRAAGM